MTAFSLASPTSYPDPRPAADVIPIGTRAPTVDPALVSLAAAAVATEVSDRCLWLEYVTLGGSRSLEWFRAHLESPDVRDADTLAEHQVVVQMFTELFDDEDIPLRVH